MISGLTIPLVFSPTAEQAIERAEVFRNGEFDAIITEHQGGQFDPLPLYRRAIEFRHAHFDMVLHMKANPELQEWMFDRIHPMDLVIFDLEDNYAVQLRGGDAVDAALERLECSNNW